MKSKKLVLVLLFLPSLIYAQYNFKPVADSLTTCSYFKLKFGQKPSTALQVYEFSDQMPVSQIPDETMSEILNNSVWLNEREKTLTGKIYIQCVVNCKGMAGDFQIIHSPDEMLPIACRLTDVFSEKITEWEPGKQNYEPVDVLIRIKIMLSEGKFKVVYSTPDANE